jgi:hypothetical protein
MHACCTQCNTHALPDNFSLWHRVTHLFHTHHSAHAYTRTTDSSTSFYIHSSSNKIPRKLTFLPSSNTASQNAPNSPSASSPPPTNPPKSPPTPPPPPSTAALPLANPSCWATSSPQRPQERKSTTTTWRSPPTTPPTRR